MPMPMPQQPTRLKTYTLERDIRPPHLDQPYKRCRTCNEVKRNDFTEYPKEQFRTQRYGPRHTTGDVCKACVSAAKSASAKARRASIAEAERIADEDIMNGTYLGAPKPVD